VNYHLIIITTIICMCVFVVSCVAEINSVCNVQPFCFGFEVVELGLDQQVVVEISIHPGDSNLNLFRFIHWLLLWLMHQSLACDFNQPSCFIFIFVFIVGSKSLPETCAISNLYIQHHNGFYKFFWDEQSIQSSCHHLLSSPGCDVHTIDRMKDGRKNIKVETHPATHCPWCWSKEVNFHTSPLMSVKTHFVQPWHTKKVSFFCVRWAASCSGVHVCFCVSGFAWGVLCAWLVLQLVNNVCLVTLLWIKGKLIWCRGGSSFIDEFLKSCTARGHWACL